MEYPVADVFQHIANVAPYMDVQKGKFWPARLPYKPKKWSFASIVLAADLS